MASISTMIQWMKDREGKVTYSQSNRLGPNSYDCSSAVYYALIAGGFLSSGTTIGNTETLYKLEGQLLQPIARGEVRRGDIFVSGFKNHSLGNDGHTGIFVDNQTIIHATYAPAYGKNGIVTTPATNWMGDYNGWPVYYYRLNGAIENNYDQILQRDGRDYSVKVKAAAESKNHGITDDVNNVRPGIVKLGTGDKYAGQAMRITEYAKTTRATYLKFGANGKTIGWMDSRAFTPTLDTVVITNTAFHAQVKASGESGNHGLYSLPNNTSEQCKRLGTGALYAGQNVEVSKSGTMSTGPTVYQFSIAGKVIGWMDSRAFTPYNRVLERDGRDYGAQVKPAAESKNHGVTDDVNNVRPGVIKLGTGDKYADQSVRIVEYAKTTQAVYVRFSINGKSIGWMDSRAFTPKLDTVVITNTVFHAQIKASSESGNHGLYTLPNNTSEQCKRLGTGALYAGQNVEVSKSGTMSTGPTVYQFSIAGKVIGWMDSRAFTPYNRVLERDGRDYGAQVKPAAESKNHGVTNDVNNVRPGVIKLGTGDKYAGQSVRIVEYAKTTQAVYVRFSINGTSIGWMDSRAFTPKLDTVVITNTVFRAQIKASGESGNHGLYTLPNNTSEQCKRLGTGALYAGQSVEVSKSGAMSTGPTVYQFSIAGKVIGWMDSRAFLKL